MGRLALLFFVACCFSLVGCPAAHGPGGDAGAPLDAPSAIDAPPLADTTLVADAPAATDAPGSCIAFCRDDLGGGCCGDSVVMASCTPTGPLCEPGFILSTSCRPAGSCTPATDWRSCNQVADCVLSDDDCCGWCADGDASDVDAVNTAFLDEHAMEVCPVPMPCPRCLMGPLDPNVVATCAHDPSTGAGTCAVVDFGPRLGGCATDAECEATYLNCCGCSGTDDEVAGVPVGSRTAIDAVLCDAGSCPLDCGPAMPPGWRAYCDAGTCRAEMGPTP